MNVLPPSWLGLSCATALILVGVSGCDGGGVTGQSTAMFLSKAPPTVPAIEANAAPQPAQQESCNARARFVPGLGCEHRRPAMADPALDEPSCEVGSLDRCLADCESGGAWSCGVLGKMYRDGIGVRRDARVAQKWQRRACALGGLDGCDGELGERPSKS